MKQQFSSNGNAEIALFVSLLVLDETLNFCYSTGGCLLYIIVPCVLVSYILLNCCSVTLFLYDFN